MALTRDFKQSVVERVQRDPAFARALFDESLALMLSGEAEAARRMLGGNVLISSAPVPN